MVNLLLVGRAATNVFDFDKTLGDENDKKEDKMELHGILKKGHIGFLTLFESYEYMTVGEHLKCPLYPIYVICSESHYSVLFHVDEKNVNEMKTVRN